MLCDIPVEVLRNKHRFTAQQVNSFLGAGTVDEDVETKLESLNLVREFVSLADALQNEGINFISLKGPVLSHMLYGDASWRHYFDFDILVDYSQAGKVAGLLKNMGYITTEFGWYTNINRKQAFINHYNEVSFFHSDKDLKVDVHFRLFNNPVVSFERLEEIVSNNLTEIRFADRSFTVLSNELNLLYVIIHGCLHWWYRLKWLVDVSDFIKTQTIDWNRFSVLSDELKAGRVTALCNSILKYYLPGGARLPINTRASRFMTGFCRKMIESSVPATNDFYQRAFGTVRYRVLSFPGLRYQMRTLRNFLFVPAYFGKNKWLSALPVFYVYGPVKLLYSRWRQKN